MKGIYLVGGYPDRTGFKECCRVIAEKGFDFIEVGIPFNDPIAEGPVIAGAIGDALGAGVTPEGVVEEITLLDIGIPVYVMTYANIIHSYGIRRFSERMAPHLRGVIIPDLPNRMARRFRKEGFTIPIVPFATLDTRESDIGMLDESESDFVYFVGLRGITGAESDFTSPELAEKARMLRRGTNKKIIIGFGIKTPEDARHATALGDGYVIGTEAVRRQGDPGALGAYLEQFADK
ncbi:MAG: tryptophan synthase subunit alpha [Spirochaetes bacterium]|nr:tryptophan synthase subunit alpha [Spirochaetota bacterium]